MVEIKTFMEGFNDLERLCETKRRMGQARYEMKRVLIDSSLGSLDDRSILTDEERGRFFKLCEALDKAEELLFDKIDEQKKKCVRMNVTGFTEDKEETKKTEENEYF